MTDESRKAFEEWAKNEPWFNGNKCYDGYVDTHTNVAYHTWQAGQAALRDEMVRELGNAKCLAPSIESDGEFYNLGLHKAIAIVKGKP